MDAQRAQNAQVLQRKVQTVSAMSAQDPQEWAFQRQVEEVLYGNGYSQQTGAVYRLLQRSGVRERALPLKKACIQQGLLTQHEYDWMYSHLVDVRSFTLIPLDALRCACSLR